MEHLQSLVHSVKLPVLHCPPEVRFLPHTFHMLVSEVKKPCLEVLNFFGNPELLRNLGKRYLGRFLQLKVVLFQSYAPSSSRNAFSQSPHRDWSASTVYDRVYGSSSDVERTLSPSDPSRNRNIRETTTVIHRTPSPTGLR